MGLLHEIETVARGWRWTRRPLVPASVEPPDDEPGSFPTEWARTPVGKLVRTALQHGALFPVLHLEVDVRVEGREVLDGLPQPVIFVGNHTSHLDAPMILSSLPLAWRQRTAVGAASDYFFDTWWRAVATTLFFNAFPVDRGGPRRSARMTRRMLAEGWNLVMFPEGTRSHDGWVAPFRSGAAWLAIEAGVPVVPLALVGAYQAMPRGDAWPAPGRPPATLRFGKPLRAEPGERPSHFTERIRRALAATLHEDRTSWWEAIRLDAEGEVPDPGGPSAARWRRVWEASRPPASPGRESAWGPGR